MRQNQETKGVKVLTATTQTQGDRASDFSWCTDGEVVALSVTCSTDRQQGPDGGCGCGRSFTGLSSHRGTTTAMVRDIEDYTADDLATAYHGYREAAGWAADGAAMLTELTELADYFPDGTVLERRGDEVRARKQG